MTRFNVCDLNAIESRVAAWVSECKPLLKVFSDNKDPYLDFANKMFGVSYEKLSADIKSKDIKVKTEAKRMRQVGKPAVLGSVYRMGGGSWQKDKNGDLYKSGLWGYAESMGIDMTQEEAHQVVKIFRSSYPEICGNGYNGEMKGIWIQLEEAVSDVLQGERTIRKIGPDDCIIIDKLTIENRLPMLRIKLPSGRYLHYLDAEMRLEKMPWTRTNSETGQIEPVFRLAFTYHGMNQDTNQWTRIVSHGGHIFENIVQAIARDILAECALRTEEKGMETCGHVHDELITLTKDDPFEPGAIDLESIMSEPMPWAPSIPLGAEGWEGDFYRK